MKKWMILLLLAVLLAGCTKKTDTIRASGTAEAPAVSDTAMAPPGEIATPASTDPVPATSAVTEPLPTTPAVTEPAPTEPAATEPAPTEPPVPAITGLVELTVPGMDPYCYPCCMTDLGEEAGFLLTRWEEETGLPSLDLYTVDPRTGTVTGPVRLEQALIGTPTRMELLGDRLLVADENQEQAAVYDRTGALVETLDDPAMAEEHRGWRNRMLRGRWIRGFDYAMQYGTYGEDKTWIGFYDDTDRIYGIPQDLSQVLSAAGRRMLAASYLSEEQAYRCQVLDLEQGLCLQEFSVPWPEDADWMSPGEGAFGGNWCLFSTTEERGEISQAKLWLWVPEQTEPRPLAVEVLDTAGLSRALARLQNKLETQYPIRFHLDEAPDPELVPTIGLEGILEEDPDFRNECLLGAEPFSEYRILLQLETFLEKLPAGFVREICTDVPGVEDWGSGLIHIYVVRDIPGDAAAFANGWVEDMMICFATEEYSSTHLAHEFMHLIDFRLMQYGFTQDRSLETEWWDLSPDWGYDLSFDDWEQTQRYFVSSYARTNGQEDRAETFQYLFDCTGPLEEAWWYQDRDGVQAKVRFLIDAIREAYPSVQATDRAWWEKVLN